LKQVKKSVQSEEDEEDEVKDKETPKVKKSLTAAETS